MQNANGYRAYFDYTFTIGSLDIMQGIININYRIVIKTKIREISILF